MNTKTEQNSSGLVAVVATDHPDLAGGFFWSRLELEWINKRLSDAEAIIAEKDAEIIEQCRLNGIGAEREAALLGQVAQQSAALKLARAAIDAHLNPCGCSNGCEFCSGKGYLSDALDAIDSLLKGE